MMMRGIAECNARNTMGREYPERHATCAHEVMLRRQAIQMCRNGCTLRTAPPPPPRQPPYADAHAARHTWTPRPRRRSRAAGRTSPSLRPWPRGTPRTQRRASCTPVNNTRISQRRAGTCSELQGLWAPGPGATRPATRLFQRRAAVGALSSFIAPHQHRAEGPTWCTRARSRSNACPTGQSTHSESTARQETPVHNAREAGATSAGVRQHSAF